MSRGLGTRQRAVLALLSDGRRWRVRQLVGPNATPSEYGVVLRALTSLADRGLVDVYVPSELGRIKRYAKHGALPNRTTGVHDHT